MATADEGERHPVRGDDDRPDLAPAQARPVHHRPQPPRRPGAVGRLPHALRARRDARGPAALGHQLPARLGGALGADRACRTSSPTTRSPRRSTSTRGCSQLGVGLDEIDYVVLSHLHFDHAGNVKMFEGTNAKLVCHQREKDFAFNFDGPVHRRAPEDRLRGPRVRDGLRRHRDPARRHAAGDPRPHHRLHVDAGRAARQRHHDLHLGRGLHGRQLGPAVHARRHRQQPGAVVLVGREAAGDPGAHRRDDGLRARRRPDPPARVAPKEFVHVTRRRSCTRRRSSPGARRR